MYEMDFLEWIGVSAGPGGRRGRKNVSHTKLLFLKTCFVKILQDYYNQKC